MYSTQSSNKNIRIYYHDYVLNSKLFCHDLSHLFMLLISWTNYTYLKITKLFCTVTRHQFKGTVEVSTHETMLNNINS